MGQGTEITNEVLERDVEVFISEQNLKTAENLVKFFMICQTIIDEDEAHIRRLYETGGLFKQIADFVTGRTKKNQKMLWANQHEIQRISCKIQEILAKELSNTKADLALLKDKMSLTEKNLQRLTVLSWNLGMDIKKTNWVGTVHNRRTETGEFYKEILKMRVLLYVISDIYQLTDGRCDMTEAEILTSLEHIGFTNGEMLSVENFYMEAIENSGKSLWLFVKDELDYEGAELSPYGRTLESIHRFFRNEVPVSPVLSGLDENRSKILCREYVKKHLKEEGMEAEMPVYDFCRKLLDDLAAAHDAMEKDRLAIKKIEDAPVMETSICVIYPEGIRTISKGQNVYTKMPRGKCYTIDRTYADVVLQTVLERLPDGNVVLAMPEAAIEKFDDFVEKFNHPEEVEDFNDQEERIKIAAVISLADFYSYLWFRNECILDDGNRKIGIAEYYDDYIYLYGYCTDDSGKQFAQCGKQSKVSRRDSEEELKDAFINKVFGVDSKKIKKENIEYIRVFSSGITGKKIDLQKLDMPHVKEKDWENGFLERPEDFEELLKAVPVKTLEE